MASTRQERMQQRLRGAQRRQVKDVDFGLSFPTTPASPQQAPTIRRTPQPELAPRSRGRARPLAAAIADESREPIIHTASNANISAKRRRLDSYDAPSSTSRSTRSSIHASRPDIYALPEDQEPEPHVGNTTNDSVERNTASEQRHEPASVTSPKLRMARTPSPPGPVHEEITESPTEAPGSGHRLRVGLKEVTLQRSQLQDVLKADTQVPTVPGKGKSQTSQTKRKRGATTPKQLGPIVKRMRRGLSSQDVSAADDLDELSPEQSQDGARYLMSRDELDELSPELPGRRGQQLHRADQFDELSPEISSRSARKLITSDRRFLDPEDEFTADVSEEAEETNDLESAAILKNNHNRKILRNKAVMESPDLDEFTQPTPPVAEKKRSKTRKVASPAQQLHPKKASTRSSGISNRKPSKKPAKSSQVRIGSPIPVMVHRMTKKVPYGKDAVDTDILNSDIPYIKRGGVNAIDVLCQVCQEIIGSGLDTLEEGRSNSDDSALRREYGTKWRALEAFGKVLHTRLLEHTINLDNTLSLQKRVRDEQKKKLALRENILRIRGEREQVGLRMDEIRIRHEKESKNAQERNDLNTVIHDIELAIEQGRSQNPYSRGGQVDMLGMELLLRRVAGQVSNKSDSGGMLRQIKDFNTFLERAALALEGRKV